jgi:hypothetical protein
MDFKQYITESQKQYHLRLKTIVPLDDEAMDKIEMMVAKYQPITISRPKKTMMQRQPLDFPNVDHAEVYILDMTFALPIAPHILRADMRKVLDAPENYVFVRTRSEPGEIQTQILNAISDITAEAETKGFTVVAMLDDPDYNEGLTFPNMYGTDYNESLLGYLGQVEQDRKDAIARIPTSYFNWLDLPDRKDQEPVQDDANYNADIEGAPYNGKSSPKKLEVDFSIFGNFDPESGEIRRTYKDKSGKKVVLTRKLKDAE